jgi:hypothetical protein
LTERAIQSGNTAVELIGTPVVAALVARIAFWVLGSYLILSRYSTALVFVVFKGDVRLT